MPDLPWYIDPNNLGMGDMSDAKVRLLGGLSLSITGEISATADADVDWVQIPGGQRQQWRDAAQKAGVDLE
jgi:hypothetical protein